MQLLHAIQPETMLTLVLSPLASIELRRQLLCGSLLNPLYFNLISWRGVT